MAITATFQIEPALISHVVSQIHEVTAAEPGLTPRSIARLTELAQSEKLAVLFADGKLAGWAAVEKLTKNISELGLLYMKPEYRSPENFNALAQLIMNSDDRYLLATYDQILIRYLKTAWHAKSTNLLGATLISRGKFITKRLNRASRNAVRSHLKQGKPLYAIVGRR